MRYMTNVNMIGMRCALEMTPTINIYQFVWQRRRVWPAAGAGESSVSAGEVYSAAAGEAGNTGITRVPKAAGAGGYWGCCGVSLSNDFCDTNGLRSFPESIKNTRRFLFHVASVFFFSWIRCCLPGRDAAGDGLMLPSKLFSCCLNTSLGLNALWEIRSLASCEYI